ncbi:MazG nucleotide pyrophosphohydrolase domain-containing protein [Halostella salina]|uniref:MazG nucleotide pyrophosphohydrolase domain-containing protein n=1 Tax=Halostella salina TaxID=1547897 RepID=UPI000EF7FB94|nr:MazG nucleotide pyrophosphohydrolase domain-containing protein [Halostella salina]
MDAQRRVAAFVERHDLHADPAYRALDLESEVGEIAKELAESTDYGASPTDADVATDELGDALFALLALADSLDADAGAALEEALDKYERRIDETGTAASGE